VKRVVVAGGGTSGHVYPALALASELRQAGVDVLYVGSGRGPEVALAADAGLAFEPIDVMGLDRRIGWRSVAAAGLLARSVGRSMGILRRASPDVVVSTGGYVGLPVAIAARVRRLPLVLHEQNAVLGLSNRLAARFADAVALSFPGTDAGVGARAHVVGNPVRPEIAALAGDEARRAARAGAAGHFGALGALEAGRRTLLLTGGSQGARRINEAALAPGGLYDRWRADDRVQVLHLTGRRNAGAVEAALGSIRQPGDRILWHAVAYTPRMDLVYALADLAVSRAGASTIAELEAAGVPAVLVPYPFAAGDHQTANAAVVERAGAAVAIADAALDAASLVDLAVGLLFDDGALARMRGAMGTLAQPGAASNLAALVRRVVSARGDGDCPAPRAASHPEHEA
jgi:UDP-N-acetylglucosamine--N-acetylmuramyl-(pentapeptide) pyrophosphoryl-undecaprenol N-acetylglucosamine transferase